MKPGTAAGRADLFTDVYDKWSWYALDSYRSFDGASEISARYDLQRYKSILFAGMGGSATAGEIVSSILDGSKVRCSVLKGSVLPDSINRDSLVFASSVSGNTFETIQVVKACQRMGIDVVTFSSGGELEKLSRNGSIPHIQISNLGAPRISLPCMVYPMLKVLESVESSIEGHVKSSLAALSELGGRIKSTVPTKQNAAKKLAMFMKDAATPICYFGAPMKPAGIRFKNSLNENSKIHAISEDIEESCHNSVVPFTFAAKDLYRVVLLRARKEDPALAGRFEIVKKFLNEGGVKMFELYGSGDSLLANIISAIYLLDYSTIYLAFLKRVDPAATPAIDYIKAAMRDAEPDASAAGYLSASLTFSDTNATS